MNTPMMSISEFKNLGYLQEVNRLFFHPLGLALVVHTDDEGISAIVGITDRRDDSDGFEFGFADDTEANLKVARDKADFVSSEFRKRRTARETLFGGITETIPSDIQKTYNAYNKLSLEAKLLVSERPGDLKALDLLIGIQKEMAAIEAMLPVRYPPVGNYNSI